MNVILGGGNFGGETATNSFSLTIFGICPVHRVEKTRSLWEGPSRARANGRSLARRSLCAPSLLLDGGEVGMCGAVWGAVRLDRVRCCRKCNGHKQIPCPLLWGSWPRPGHLSREKGRGGNPPPQLKLARPTRHIWAVKNCWGPNTRGGATCRRGTFPLDPSAPNPS